VPDTAERICEYSSSAWEHRRENYYYCSLPDGSQYMLSVRRPLPSQFARQRWAGLHGRAAEWDWGIVPGYDNIAETVRGLRAMDRALRPLWLDLAQELDDDLRETIKAYNSGAERFATATEDFPEQSTLPAELEAFAQGTEGMILDAGAGACRDGYWLATHGATVLAVDASGPLLATGPEHPNMSKIEADVRVLPLPDGSVGGVWCSAVLLHLSPVNAARAVAEFRRVLRPGGLVQLSTKEDPGVSMAVMPGSSGQRRVQYVHSVDAMCRLVTDGGFRVERTWDEIQRHGNGLTTRWLKVLARAV
jgi:SAM-dependent methyltransferase